MTKRNRGIIIMTKRKRYIKRGHCIMLFMRNKMSHYKLHDAKFPKSFAANDG